MEQQHIGFIGLGAMGYAMAMNVRKHMDPKATLYIHDVHRTSCEKFKASFAEFGPIEIVSSAKLVSEGAMTIVSIVPTSNNVRDVYLDETNGVIAACRPDNASLDRQRLYLECSTIDIATAEEVASFLEKENMGRYVDTPVSGGVPAAEKGALSFLLGAAQPGDGTSHDLVTKRLQSVVEYMGDAAKVFFCGSLGKGLAAKICNNYLSCTILLANCEAMATGRLLGLDKHLLHKVIQCSSGQNFMADHVAPVPGTVPHAPSSNNYKLGFKSQMLVKDVSLGVDAAKSVGIKPSIGEAAIEVYKKLARDPRFIDRDGSIVYRFLGGPEN